MALTFVGCLDEGDDGCPNDMTLIFKLEDTHVGGDFDSRIGNDVLLYVFRDGKCIDSQTIPYEEIRDGKYTFRKPDGMEGNLSLLAWSVSDSGDAAALPNWAVSDALDDLYIELPSASSPMHCEMYNGSTEPFKEAIDQESSHTISMIHTACRVEVNVKANSAVITTDNPNVTITGSMTRMDMSLAGTGNAAVVKTSLLPDSGVGEYATGRFGILPSSAGQTIAVNIYDDNEPLATLKVPRDNLPRGAEAGDLMIFDYQLGDTEFWLTVNGFRQKIVMIDM